MEDRCQVCGARFRETEAVKCHECGAPRRNTFLPEEPGGAPIDAAASLATVPFTPLKLTTPGSSPAASSATFPIPAEPSETETVVAPAPAPSAPAPAATPSGGSPSGSYPGVPPSGSYPAASQVAASASGSHAAASQVAASVSGSHAAASQVAASASGSHAAASQAAASASGLAPSVESSAPFQPGADQSTAAPAAVAPAISEPLGRKGGSRGLLMPMLGGAAIAVIGVAVFVMVSKSEPKAEAKGDDQTPISISARGVEPPDCEDLEALAGDWVFATATTNARKEARVGMRGFFELSVKVRDCSAEATLVKVGRKGKPHFAEPKKPRAKATLTPGVGLYEFGFGGHFELKNEDRQGVPLRVTFAREGERLVGAWRQVGERWDSSGMYGVLVGEREGDPRKIRARRKEQPCTIKCATPEDIGEVDLPDANKIKACRAACG